MPWATREQARAQWPDAASIPDDTLDQLLDVATIQAQAFAPALVVPIDPADLVIPPNYVQATIYQAREVYAAGQRDGDVIGLGDYAIRARPLTASVKSLLRPQAGVPVVG